MKNVEIAVGIVLTGLMVLAVPAMLILVVFGGAI